MPAQRDSQSHAWECADEHDAVEVREFPKLGGRPPDQGGLKGEDAEGRRRDPKCQGPPPFRPARIP